ncbi:MAG TPA: hypothetical protein VFR84_13215 [Candidatus Angelobacter sp.]|nr:hypothetical protein [Candidatus Angelobacter sp.]
MKFVPAGDVISELEKTAADCEKASREMPEPEAAKLRNLAERCRGPIMSLKYGNWTSWIRHPPQ